MTAVLCYTPDGISDMSRYLSIVAIQRPFPFQVDENDRTMYTMNFDVKAAAPVNQFEEEILSHLNSLGLATGGTDAFLGPNARIPTGNGPYINIIDTGGVTADMTHDGLEYENLSVHIVVRALDPEVARTRSLAIWRALDGLYDTTIAA